MKLNFRRGSAFASKNANDYLQTISPRDIKKVAVIRHAAIGDFMNIRPFLIELKKFFPNVQITLSVNGDSMYGIPQDLIDDVHVMDKKIDGKKTSLLQRIKQAKALEPQDIIFDLTDSSMTLLLIIFSQARLKVGYSYRAFRRYFYDISTLRSDFLIEAQSILQMLNVFGCITHRTLQYGYEKQYTKSDKKRIIYFPGASVDTKCWPKEKFQSLIDKLSDEYPSYEHIILQGIRETEKFLDIYEPLAHKNNVSIQEVLELDKAMSFLSNSRCLVSNDTGVRNMAIATQTPTVGIFFEIPPFRYWPREEKHECVFNIEYKHPGVEDVYSSTANLINRLYEK